MYQFTNLDFRDKITGIPLQYDVYVQKIKVKYIKPKNLFISTENDDDAEYYYIVSDIAVNNILGNDPNTKGVSFYFKVNGTTQIVYVKYNLFEDILEKLGSYYSIFDIVAAFCAYFYADFFFQADLLNSTFSFNENATKNINRKYKTKNYNDTSIEVEEPSNENPESSGHIKNKNDINEEINEKINENIIVLEMKTKPDGIILIKLFKHRYKTCWNG